MTAQCLLSRTSACVVAARSGRQTLAPTRSLLTCACRLSLLPPPPTHSQDLVIQRTVGLREALTGVDFTMKHLDGRLLHIKSPAGGVIKPSSFQCVPDEGMPFPGRPYVKGHLYVHFKVGQGMLGGLGMGCKQRKREAQGLRARKVEPRAAVTAGQTGGALLPSTTPPPTWAYLAPSLSLQVVFPKTLDADVVEGLRGLLPAGAGEANGSSASGGGDVDMADAEPCTMRHAADSIEDFQVRRCRGVGGVKGGASQGSRAG